MSKNCKRVNTDPDFGLQLEGNRIAAATPRDERDGR